ncbi:MAG TPA: ATPase, T2SS/T4P/T4SS family [Polyangiaceae bacterium]|jgi:pilus assembly protein CpaF|nr:ATPase, T2SS/T4P/T4SS family [Polyangiaceae bacterium]
MIPNEVFAETLLGFLSPVRRYLDDPSVTEVMINGPRQVYVERRGRLELTNTVFPTSESVMCALRNAAQFVGKTLDELNPILEARMPDGSRLQAVIPPAAPDGPYVSIRRFSKDVLDLGNLIDKGSVTVEAAQTLQALVHAKLNVLIAGGTGSGKTSLLNVLTRFVPDGERIAVIEDSREVDVQKAHVVYLEARPADHDGRGAVSIRELFRATLRMRPDRIIIGEIRGGEALDIVQAMVSGHGGCMGTLHATYPRDTLTRLETMAMMSDVELPLAALRLQIASGVNVIVQVARSAGGSRHVTHITEVVEFDLASGRYVLNDVFVREYGALGDDGNVESRLLPTGVLPTFIPTLRAHGVDLPDAVYEAQEITEQRDGRK